MVGLRKLDPPYNNVSLSAQDSIEETLSVCLSSECIEESGKKDNDRTQDAQGNEPMQTRGYRETSVQPLCHIPNTVIPAGSTLRLRTVTGISLFGGGTDMASLVWFGGGDTSGGGPVDRWRSINHVSRKSDDEIVGNVVSASLDHFVFPGRHPNLHVRDMFGQCAKVLHVVDILHVSRIKQTEIPITIVVDEENHGRSPQVVAQTFVALPQFLLNNGKAVVTAQGVTALANRASHLGKLRTDAAGLGRNTPRRTRQFTCLRQPAGDVLGPAVSRDEL